MTTLELASLSLRTASAPAALRGIERYMSEQRTAGKLCAVWTTEIGRLNRILVVRAFEQRDDLLAERVRIIESGDFFGASDQLLECTFDTWVPFPFLTLQLSGAFGRMYEVRIYSIKPPGMRPVLAAWEAALPDRVKLSPVLFAGYAIDGITPRMIHVTPYPDLNERVRIRGEAVAAGIWPPKGGADWFTVMDSAICLPAQFSPLR